jgi:8-oxo-dGTP pyrophosphatase MutT (NUDIX family)
MEGNAALPPESTLTAKDWRTALTTSLAHTAPAHERESWLVPGLTSLESRALEYAYPRSPRAAAVLIAVVDYPDALTILLTTRATRLRNHAGQISFPGGALEPNETPLDAALREAREETGLRPNLVTLVGYLPDHILLSGFRVTPVVAFVQPGFEIQADSAEVHDVFEVPLERLFDISNYITSVRRIGRDRVPLLEQEISLETHSISFEGRDIWGATAGILLNLARRCVSALPSGTT